MLATHQSSAGNLRPVSPCTALPRRGGIPHGEDWEGAWDGAGWEGGWSRSRSAQHGDKEHFGALKLKEEERVVAGEAGGWGQVISGEENRS